jgi:hypothetical protein
MEKELEVITIDDKDYVIIEEVDHENDKYLYLSNVIDEEDTLIRKINKDDENKVLPLRDENEFELACNLLFKFLAN